MSCRPSRDIHWGPSLLTGVQFVFKDKAIIVPDLSPKFTSVQNSKLNYEFSFDFERKILEDYKAAEEFKWQKAKRRMEAESFNIEKPEPNESPVSAVPQLTAIEPAKTELLPTDPLATSKLPYKVDRSVLEDFEFQAMRDDPFVAAELGTINDLEELRDVLASMQVTERMNIETKKANMYTSLKNISFPHLSLDDNYIDANASSAPSSQLNLFTQPNETFNISVNAPVKTEKADEPSGSERPLSQGGVSPVKFDLGCVATESEDQSIAGYLSHIDKPDIDTSYSSPFQDKKMKSFRSPSQNVIHIPIPLENEITLDQWKPETPRDHFDECRVDDPPSVCRLVKMGFKRNKILALYNNAERNEDKSDDTTICQLCNWSELEDKGLEQDVCLAAVTFAPNDLEKALEFGKMVSELSEMGFKLNSVVSAVRASNMIKEEAVMHLLEPNGGSAATSHSSLVERQSPHTRTHTQVRGIGWKGKKKVKKSYTYLHAKH